VWFFRIRLRQSVQSADPDESAIPVYEAVLYHETFLLHAVIPAA
jgi:hypothetical protein